MKCPLMILADYLKKGGTVEEIGDCLKEECALWDDGTPGCAELAKAKSLQEIEGLLFELVSKMPDELQFRK